MENKQVLERVKLKMRYQTIVDVSQYLVAVSKHEGAINPFFIQKLEAMRKPLMLMIATQDILSPLASARLSSLNHAIQYAKTANASDKKSMISEYKKGDRIADRIRKVGVFDD